MHQQASTALRVGRVARTSVLPLALLVLLAACGRPAVLDVDRAEGRIRTSLTETFEVEVASVRCPERVEVEEGATFSCQARLADDATLEVSVRQTDDEGALTVEPTRAVLVTARVEADIAEELDDRFARDDVEVTCPGGPQRLEEPQATFTCTARDGDERKEVEVEVRDARGALTYTLR